MSIFGTLGTAVSGMAAQANYLGTISDNIANASTTGYKSASIAFETMLGNQTPGNYTSGGVETLTRYSIGDQGALTSTSSTTDLAISGSGFFLVQGPDGSTAMTRAGAFVPNASGDLVNTAGFKLLGYSLANGAGTPSGSGAAALQVVRLPGGEVSATASQSGTLDFNAPSTAAAVTGATPATNTAGSTFTAKTSLTAYDDLGAPVNLDVYLTNTGAGAWQATVFDHADAAASGGFPYSAGPLSSQTLTYSQSTGKLTAVGGSASPLALSVQIPNGNTISIDVSRSTQLASAFSVSAASIDGNAPSTMSNVSIASDGTVTAQYANGQSKAIYQIPLADVPSENNLTPLSGDVYQANAASGVMTIGKAGSGSLGQIASSSLENSDVDLATQLTDMISAQRSYQANSKVIQASSDLLTIIEQLHTSS